MGPIRGRLVFVPQGRLGLVAVPGVALTCDVTVEDRVVLELVPAEAPRERVLGPDDLAPNGKAGCLECILKSPVPGDGWQTYIEAPLFTTVRYEVNTPCRKLRNCSAVILSPLIFSRSSV
jgi:hypothetical protein